MTNLEELWQRHQPDTNGLPDMTNLGVLKPVEGLSVLKRMKKMLLINLPFEMAIAAAYFIIMITNPSWQLVVLLSVAFIFTIWGAWGTYLLYRGIDAGVKSTSLLTELTRNRDALQAWTRLQMRIALFVYPFCITGGFLLGGIVSSGKSIDVFIAKPAVLYALPVTIIMLMPLSYWLAKRLFRSTFGKLLEQFNEYIKSINQIN